MKRALAAVTLLAAIFPAWAVPTPITTISTQLTGDPRPDSPDGIYIDVEGKQLAGDPGAFIFSVDFNALTFDTHPTANLHEFYWNLAPADASYWEVTVLSDGWLNKSPSDVIGGGAGGNQFLFENTDPARPDAVMPLEFLIETADNSEIFAEHFIDAAQWSGADGELLGQLGAHVRMLGPDGSDSGFAIGDWCPDGSCGGGGGGGGGGNAVPEPGSLALLSLGLIGLLVSRRREK
jgi:hypothetical protein